MLAQRAFTRRLAQSAPRTVLRRTYASHGIGESGLQGAADNAFNRERAAVKQHAADTSGAYLPIYHCPQPKTHNPQCVPISGERRD